MKITGPFRDLKKKSSGFPKTWYLRIKVPRTKPDGRPELDEKGRPILRRERPYYATQNAAIADIPRLQAQHATAGASAGGVLSRAELEDYEQARREVPEAPLLALARFWRRHHPREATSTLVQLVPQFLEWVKARLGEERHYSDLVSRVGPKSKFMAKFGDRLPATITREEFLAWLLALGNVGRTVLNQKRAVVNFFNWLVDVAKVIPTNPLAGIKKRALPRDIPKEIEYLSLDEVSRYLRTLERYDPELIAHELIQLMAGVRADDEMADFDGKWVLANTQQILIPAEIAKTERREVIDNLEPNFWEWWKHYGRHGIVRPKNYEQRWERVRILATVLDRAQADEIAALPIKTLRARPESKAALHSWPWNARRRTFCTYKVAKDQSAAAAALILRHRGDAETLHNSYRGLGVTKEEGIAYFAIVPNPVSRVIYPARALRGVILLQRERGKLEASGLAPKAVA